MDPNPNSVRDRVVDHFSPESDRRDVWTGLDLFLDTDAFLNLGYSRWYQPHWLPSSQRRLVDVVAGQVKSKLSGTEQRGPWSHVSKPGPILAGGLSGSKRARKSRMFGSDPVAGQSESASGPPDLLDIGSGRGGPAIRLADRWGFEVLGVDIVGANVVHSRSKGAAAGVDNRVSFVHAEAGSLPVATDSMRACTAIDSLVYMPDTATVASEVCRVLGQDGVFVVSDLVRASAEGADGDRTPQDRSGEPQQRASGTDPTQEFTAAWDMPELATRDELVDSIDAAGMEIRTVRDISPYSIRQFGRYSRAYLGLADGPFGPAVRELCRRFGMDESVVTEQIRAAHRALPELEHVLIVARNVDS